MVFENILKLRPDLQDKIDSVDYKTLVNYYKEISILNDLSDKSYDNQEINSPFIAILNDTHIVSYFIDKYQVTKKEWLHFMLDVNKLISEINISDIDVIISKVDKISNEFFSKYIPVENEFDKDFVEKLGITLNEELNDLWFITSTFSELVYQLLEENLKVRSFVLEVIIEWIKDWNDIPNIVNRINNVMIANHD